MDLHTYLQNLKGKRVGIIGIGVSNRPLIDMLLAAGIDVTACDKRTREQFGSLAEELEAKGCKLILGEDYLEQLDMDVIFRTPGLHPRYLEKAKAKGSMITSEMEAFFDVCPCPIIAITGSDGKTTTTTVVSQLLKAAGKCVYVGGNIGNPLLAQAGDMKAGDVVVLELSSFQLMTMTKSPSVAVVTNLAPNHLDIHTDMAEYIDAKKNIFLHQRAADKVILNLDNEITNSLVGEAVGKVVGFTRKSVPATGTFIRDNAIWMKNEEGEREVLKCGDIRIPGIHNVENYMAAIAAVDGLVDDEVIRTFARTFGGVEHRIEFIRELRGVKWYNDSIASSPSRTAACLHSFAEKIILLAGGKDKGVSYDELGVLINDHVKYLILCGATAKVIREGVEKAANYAGLPVVTCDSWEEVVMKADAVAEDGDIVVMSNASTSFDMFPNFAQRGKVFKELVNALK